MNKRVYFSSELKEKFEEAFAGHGFTVGADTNNADIIFVGGGAVCHDCASLRHENKTAVIIAVSDNYETRITAYEAGADDCVPADITQRELLLKVTAICNRVCKYDTDITVCGELYLDRRKRAVVEVGSGKIIELTQIEYRIIECFFNSPDVLLDRMKILSDVWNGNYYGDERVLDVNIRRLRIKIEKDSTKPRHLVTVWGKGYMWRT